MKLKFTSVKMKKILILSMFMGICMIGLVAAEDTNFTNSGFNVAVINLLSIFTIAIPVIIAGAILFFFLRGGEYGVNPVTVLLIGGVAVLISIFLTPIVIKAIVDAIWG